MEPRPPPTHPVAVRGREPDPTPEELRAALRTFSSAQYPPTRRGFRFSVVAAVLTIAGAMVLVAVVGYALFGPRGVVGALCAFLLVFLVRALPSLAGGVTRHLERRRATRLVTERRDATRRGPPTQPAPT